MNKETHAAVQDSDKTPDSGAVSESGSVEEPVEVLRGSRSLRPEDIDFSEEIYDEDGNLNFYIPCWFHVDEVFGTHVEEPNTDDYINIYANYDLESGQVCDTLDISLWKSDGTNEAYVYRLNEEEQAILLSKMDAYCQEQTGLSLSESRDLYLKEKEQENGKLVSMTEGVKSHTDNTVLDEYPVPDPSVSPELLEIMDCPRKDLLPLSADRACDLLEDMTVYAALPLGVLEMPVTIEEVRSYPPHTVFAVPRHEWEKSAEFRTAVSARMNRQDEREGAFLQHSGNCFAIYQFRAGGASCEPACRTLEAARVQGLSPRNYSYGLVFTASLPEGVGIEELHTRFADSPQRDFPHRAVQPGDIIAVRENGVLTPWYVDTLSYSRLDGLFQNLPAYQRTQEGRGEMTGEELNKALYDKMSVELARFKDWLKAQPPETIIQHAYECAMKEDILLSMEYNDLDDEQARALLNAQNPLEMAYNSFENMQTGHMEYIQESVEIVADDLVRQEKREQQERLRPQPLTPEEVTAEAQRLLDALKAEREPNSPNETHFMAEISPDFLRRANDKNRDALLRLLPFKSISFSSLEGRIGTFALISKDEDRASKTTLRKAGTRRKKRPER